MSEAQSNAEVAKETSMNEMIKEVTSQVAQEMTMEDVMETTMLEYKSGKRVTATVISANESGIIVNIGGKKDGFIDKADASIDGSYNPSDYNENDIVEAIIIKAQDKSCVSLSKKEVDILIKNDEEAKKIIEGGEFALIPTQVVKGGLIGKIGSYTIFIPASQIKLGYVKELDKYVGKTLRLKALPPKESTEDKPVKKNAKLIVASQRVILEAERFEREEAFWSTMNVGDIVNGKVKRFSDFGAFVSVKGFDCLAHISDLSWSKISDPSKALTINESYDFVILKVDRESSKISLGFKQLQKKPYEIAAEKYPVDSVIQGKVERIFPFGAFVSIDDGVDGLVHVSQISHEWIKDANDALKVGQEVEAKIISFEDNKITLSIKELLPVPEFVENTNFISPDNYSDDASKAPKRSPKAMNFNVEKFDKKVDRRDRRPRRDESSDAPREWVSDNGLASLGDLFKNLNIDFGDNEEK